MVRPLHLFGPHGLYEALSASKAFPIHEGLQGEFLNVWNHPVFGSLNSSTFDKSVQDSSFATGKVTNTPRVIEFRANVAF